MTTQETKNTDQATTSETKNAVDADSPKREAAKHPTATSEEYAAAKMAKLKKKGKSELDVFKKDLEKKSVEELTAFYNEMVPTAIDLGIKKINVRKDVFMTQPMGRRACEQLHIQILRARDETTKQQEKTVKRATSKKLNGKSKGKKSSGDRAKRLSLEDTAKIKWLGKDIPFRDGSGKQKRMLNLKSHDGKTVKTFLSSKLGKPGTLSFSVRNRFVTVA